MSRISRRSFLRASGGAATFTVLAGCMGGDGDGDGDGDGSGDGAGDGNGDGDGGGTPAGSPTPSDGEPIVIGGLEPLSGPFAPWANVHRAGLQYALDEVNEEGGVLGGRELELTVTDTGADAGQADSSFRQMVEQDGAVATTGAVSSDVGVRLSQTAEELQVPHVLHMAGDDQITNENSRHIFRLGLVPAPTYIEAQATAFAGDYTNIGAVIGDYAWGRAVERAIESQFEQDVNIQVAPLGESNFRSFIRQFDEGLEMLIASGHPPGSVAIANQAFELGLTPDIVTGASTPPQLLAGALNDDARAGYTHIHQSDPYGDEFAQVAEAFGEATGEQFNTHTAYGYATGRMLAAAIDDAGSAEPTAIADAIRNIEFETVMAAPLQYTEYGELDQQVVIYSRILTGEAPPYFGDGEYNYSEVSRSDPIPAAPAEL